MRVVFKNLEPSELARGIARDRLKDILDKFPDIEPHHVKVTLSMENSSKQPGADSYGVKIQMHSKRIGSLILEKKAPSLYQAVSNLKDVLLERLNRANDRKRVHERKRKRQYKEEVRVAS